MKVKHQHECTMLHRAHAAALHNAMLCPLQGARRGTRPPRFFSPASCEFSTSPSPQRDNVLTRHKAALHRGALGAHHDDLAGTVVGLRCGRERDRALMYDHICQLAVLRGGLGEKGLRFLVGNAPVVYWLPAH